MKPTIGRIVIYTLTDYDALAINQRRSDFDSYRAKHAESAIQGGDHGRTGHVGHVGNRVAEGDEYPAMVVRDWSAELGTVNLKVQLDGDDTYWATSRTHDEHGKPGFWHWQPDVEREPGDRPASSTSHTDFRTGSPS
jgi:hypothetical protein